MKFQDLFGTQLEAFVKANGKGRTAIFFRGFGRLQNKTILARKDALSAENIGNADGTLNIPAMDAARENLAEALLSSQGVCVALYEELIAMLSVVPDLAQQYSGRIVIADNNLFQNCFPAAIANGTAATLYSYFQSETPDVPAELAAYLNYYGDVVSLDETHYFTSPLRRDAMEAAAEIVPFFTEGSKKKSKDIPKGTPVSVSGPEFLIGKADLLEDRLPDNAVYIIDSRTDAESRALPAFAGILDALGVAYGVRQFCEFNVSFKDEADRHLPLLRKYWGENAAFRTLKFYRAPTSANDTVEISQGEIISGIVDQSKAVLAKHRDFHDIFITAPTGAGKSLLFQLPAIHLAEESNAVTIVITPLIALMKDQVTQLEQEHHVTCATYINSTLTFEEREKRVEEIREGTKSIIYLAPELLVSTSLETITGGRPVGLFVIDEAHIVTSWGKDFRADYWYLGDFLKRLRRDGVWFPVLCLTATAVYGGGEDVVDETIRSLFLSRPLIYLGSVRRDNISFDIRHVSPKSVTGGVEQFKAKKAAAVIREFVEHGEKSLVYCPFTTQVDDIYMALDAEIRPKVKKYYGTLDKQARDEAQNSFRTGECMVMICTKAFGMGVDVKDIRNVYHFAPTGSLADYVQEIGRAAREESSAGCAGTDFLPTDIRYVRTLNSISEMKQYQLREMLRKLCEIYKEKKKRGIFLSPDAFSYLFGGRGDLENKVKNGLLLLSKDLESRCGYPMITVRPRAILTRSFVNVPNSATAAFEAKYGAAVKRLDDNTRRVLPSRNKRYESDTIVVNSGKIYELDMPAVWEGHFRDMSFSQFNYRFFGGDLFHAASGDPFSPRIHIRAIYSMPFPELKEKLKDYCTTLSNIFRNLKSQGKFFTAESFKKSFAEAFGDRPECKEFAGMLLELFIADAAHNTGFRSNSDRLKFIAARKAPSGEMVYHVMNSGYITMPNYFVQLVSQCPPGDNNIYQAFIPLGRNNRRPERLRLLSFLELIGLASYEVEGSQNMEVFVRVNDPERLLGISSEKYSNSVLTEICRRHRTAQGVMLGFMSHDLTSDQRWDVIEDYFLGREKAVQKALQTEEPEIGHKPETE